MAKNNDRPLPINAAYLAWLPCRGKSATMPSHGRAILPTCAAEPPQMQHPARPARPDVRERSAIPSRPDRQSPAADARHDRVRPIQHVVPRYAPPVRHAVGKARPTVARPPLRQQLLAVFAQLCQAGGKQPTPGRSAGTKHHDCHTAEAKKKRGQTAQHQQSVAIP